MSNLRFLAHKSQVVFENSMIDRYSKWLAKESRQQKKRYLLLAIGIIFSASIATILPMLFAKLLTKLLHG